TCTTRARLPRRTDKDLKARQQKSAVHGECLPGNVGTFLRSQQQRKFRNVRRLSQSRKRLFAKHGGSLCFILPVMLAERRLNQTGCNSIYVNALWSELQPIRLRHHDERGLRHAV